MTEQEARTKCCPIHGRGTQSDGNWMFPCNASDCMMWEPDERQPRETMRHRKENTYDAIAGSLRIVNGEPWRYEYSDVDDKGEYDLLHRALPEEQTAKCGHCGLGGH